MTKIKFAAGLILLLSLLGSTAATYNPDVHKWRQLGLMGTVTGLCDIAPVPNFNCLFAATYNPSGAETIWRSASTPLGANWQRMLTMNTASDRVILRLSQNYRADNTIGVAEVGADRIGVSNNNGHSWQWHSAPGSVVDMMITDKNTIYAALSNGYLATSTDGGRKWPQLVHTGIFNINMLAMAGRDTILVGGRDGDVAYSIDAGASFTRIPELVGSGNVQIVPDANFAKNSIIYAGNSNMIYRRAIGASSDWEIIRTMGANRQVSGLAIADGVLYAAWYNTAGTGSGVERYLEPTKSTTYLEYDTLDNGSESARFDATPRSLQVTRATRGVRLWAIDTAGPALMVYDDTLTRAAPTLVSPANGIDLILGTPVIFSIKTMPNVTTCEIQYSPDSTFKLEVTSLTITTPVTQTTFQSLNEGGYWRARATAPVRSPWSKVWAIGAQPTSALNAPTLLAPGSQAGSTANVNINPVFKWSAIKYATGYELQLAKNAGMSNPIANLTGTNAVGNVTSWKCTTTLEYSTTYYWRVRAIMGTAVTYSDWSNVVSFTTMAAPVAPAPPAVTPPTPPAPPTPVPTTPVPTTPGYLVAIISIGIILAIVLITMAVKKFSLHVLSSLPPTPAPKPKLVPPPELISAPKPAQVSVPTPTETEVTAEELCSAYEANKVVADAKYKDKILTVTGVVDSIGEDILHNPFVRLTGGGKHQACGARCVLNKKYEPELAQLTIGQTLTVQGKCYGRLMNVLMKDCALIR